MSAVTFIIPRRCLLCRCWSRTLDWIVGISIADYGLRCLDRDACADRCAALSTSVIPLAAERSH